MVQIRGVEQHKKTLLLCIRSALDIRRDRWEDYARDLVFARREEKTFPCENESTRMKKALEIFYQIFPKCQLGDLSPFLAEIEKLEKKVEDWESAKPLRLSREEFMLLLSIVEEYFRTRYAQVFYLADSLCSYRHSKNFVSKRDACLELLQNGVKEAQPYRNQVVIYKDPSCMEAEDIWSVFSNKYHWFRVKKKEINKKEFSKNSYPPLLLTNTPKIQCWFDKG